MTQRTPFTGFSRPRATQGPDSAGLDLAAVRAARVAHTAGAVRADGAAPQSGATPTASTATLTLPSVSLEIPTVSEPAATAAAETPLTPTADGPASRSGEVGANSAPASGGSPVVAPAPGSGETPSAGPTSAAIPIVAEAPLTGEQPQREAAPVTGDVPSSRDDVSTEVPVTAPSGANSVVEGQIVKPAPTLAARPMSTQIPTGAAPSDDDRDDLERAVDLRVSGPALMTLATHPRAVVRAAVAGRADCPTTALVSLSHDQAPEVLIALLSNPRTPASTVRNLADHRNTKVADLAVQRLRNQYR